MWRAAAAAQRRAGDARGVHAGRRPKVPLTVVRPQLTFSDGRTSHAGTAFVLDSSRPLAVVSSHVVLALRRNADLQTLELVNASSRSTLAKATGLAIPAGDPMNGWDFSTDVALVVIAGQPDGIARLSLAAERPRPSETTSRYASVLRTVSKRRCRWPEP